VGLAPSAVAAQVLADDLGIQTENTAKWLDTHDRAGETFRKGQLVIVDEASLAGTLSLDRITALAAEAGAKVLLVGDHAQLQSVTAGGAFSLLVHDRDDAPELVDVLPRRRAAQAQGGL
ncbi:AAA family ATPase, partial [Mycobacterium tuberculosis]|nr:AAA family ATPase [Mycobacterium tuberculosis]